MKNSSNFLNHNALIRTLLSNISKEHLRPTTQINQNNFYLISYHGKCFRNYILPEFIIYFSLLITNYFQIIVKKACIVQLLFTIVNNTYTTMLKIQSLKKE